MILLKPGIKSFRSELASGWDFFGIPNPEIYFGLDRKIPTSRGSGSGFQDPQKIPKIPYIEIGILKPLKIPEKSRVRKYKKNFLGFSRYSDFREFFGIFAKSPGFEVFVDSGFLSQGFSSLGYGIFLVSRFLSPGFGIFLNVGIFYLRDILGIFYPRDRDFFRGMGYPNKKPPLAYNLLKLIII